MSVRSVAGAILLSLGLLLATPAAWANCSLVSGNPAVADDARYSLSEPVSGEFVVEDARTGLVWAQCPQGLSAAACGSGSRAAVDWASALQIARSSSHAGFDDWRLPNVSELRSLIETGCAAPAINTTRFPANGGGRFWSSTTYRGNLSNAWNVDFADGNLEVNVKSNLFALRLVRGGSGLTRFNAALDYTPTAPAFAAVQEVARGSLQTSGSVTLGGLDTVIGIKVSGGEYALNGGAFTALPGVVQAGDTLRLRHTSAADFLTATVTTITLGQVSSSFSSTTLPSPNADLATLSLSAGSLSPGFAAGVLDYSASVAASVDSLQLTATAAAAGATLRVNGVLTASGLPSAALPLATGDNEIAIAVTAQDGVTARSYRITVNRAQGSSSTLLSSNANPANVGSPLQLSASVSGNAPQGSVDFRRDGVSLPGCGARPLSASGAPRIATCDIASLAAGSHALSAHYSGDVDNAASSGGLQQLINAAPTLQAASTALSGNEDSELSLTIELADVDSALSDLSLQVLSDAPALVSDSQLAAGVSGSGAQRTLRFTPQANAHGNATLTLRVSDPLGARSEQTVALQVLAVNDPPAASFGVDPVHAVGSSGAISLPGFASAISAGPGDEAAQALSFELIVRSDPDAVLDAIALSATGTLDYTLSGRSGVAEVDITTVDDGGSERGGQPRGSARRLRIRVGDGSDLGLRIERLQPQPSLPAAIALGQRLASYRITISNRGPLALQGIRLRGSAQLLDALWSCSLAASSCTPVNGSGAISTGFDLASGSSASVQIDGEAWALPFIEVAAEVQADALLFNRGDDRVVLNDRSGGDAIFRDGME